jgi:hypothetical protein
MEEGSVVSVVRGRRYPPSVSRVSRGLACTLVKACEGRKEKIFAGDALIYVCAAGPCQLLSETAGAPPNSA